MKKSLVCVFRCFFAEESTHFVDCNGEVIAMLAVDTGRKLCFMFLSVEKCKNMERALYKQLIEWKNDKYRKPLILNGARQVGKTWLLREFGKKEYENVVYFNCDTDKDLQTIFNMNFDINRILCSLSALSHIDIKPQKTLIIIDEIQELPITISALKYFCEDAPDYHVAVAGSMLGVALHSGISFPVGKVNTLRLYPMISQNTLPLKRLHE